MKFKRHANPPYAYVIVVAAVAIMICLWGVFYSFGIFFKSMMDEFGWNRAMVSGGFSLASLTNGFAAAYLGWLNDRINSRKVMTLCGICLGAGCLLLSRTDTLIHFYICYGLIIGFALGGSFIPLISTVTRWFEADRGLMSGIVASAVGIGALLGPQISNRLLKVFGWRDVYFITGIATLIIIVTAAQFLRPPPRKKLSANQGKQTDLDMTSVETGGVSLKTALASGQFWLFSITFFSYGYCLFSLTVHAVPYAIDIGITPDLAAGLLSIYGALSIFGKILFGKLLDLINGKRTMALGFCAMSIAFLILANSNQTWTVFLGVGLFGFFYGACTVTHAALTAVLFGLKSHGSILGMLGIGVTIGGAIGPLVTGFIFDQLQTSGSAFTICMAVSLLGLVATLTIKHRRIQ